MLTVKTKPTSMSAKNVQTSLVLTQDKNCDKEQKQLD